MGLRILVVEDDKHIRRILETLLTRDPDLVAHAPELVTEAVRALAAAGAVPSAVVPLPGAYPRSLLPALEARVGEGELSLRGVNPVTLAVPDALLVDVDTAEALAALETEASR